MDLRVDLHLHTTASDGRWPPEQLVDQVRRAGIGFFAVTDHDSLGSLSETAELVRGSGLRFLPGVELSSTLNGQGYHLLAYGFDLENPALRDLVTANNARLTGASDEAVRLLARLGYRVSLDDYARYSWDRRRGGWKGLNYLIDQGICGDVHEYFRMFEAIGHPKAEFPPVHEVVECVRQASGVVVLAHPGASFYNGTDVERLDLLVEMGVGGLECFSFHHDEAMTRGYLAYCHSRDLLITGGSDCHGGFAGREIGVPPVFADDLRLGNLEDSVIA
jgi:predicted metal-dependent phosphoesterase TrpH